jgi:serine/threonine protein kinase
MLALHDYIILPPPMPISHSLTPTVLSAGQPLMIDFGTAVEASSFPLPALSPLWQRGTPAYVSPDTVADDTPVSYAQACARDVFALGYLIAEVFSGVPPHDGLPPATITARARAGEVPGLSSVPGPLRGTVQQMCAAEWPRRCSAAEAEAAVAKWVREGALA